MLKSFLEKYTKRHIPDESTLRKNFVKPIYTSTIEKIKQVVAEHPVAFILDETTDAMQRYILNILVVPLNGKPTEPMLLKVNFSEMSINFM